MAVPILLPDLGENAGPLRVSCWLADPGDSLEEGDRVVEVLLLGVTFDVCAPATGVLIAIAQANDAEVAPGDILGWIDAEST